MSVRYLIGDYTMMLIINDDDSGRTEWGENRGESSRVFPLEGSLQAAHIDLNRMITLHAAKNGRDKNVLMF